MSKLYHDEFLKLLSRPQEPPVPLPRDPQYPGLLLPFLGQSLLFNRSPEEMKMAFDAYHQELSKLQQGTATGMGLGAAGESRHTYVRACHPYTEKHMTTPVDVYLIIHPNTSSLIRLSSSCRTCLYTPTVHLSVHYYTVPHLFIYTCNQPDCTHQYYVRLH